MQLTTTQAPQATAPLSTPLSQRLGYGWARSPPGLVDKQWSAVHLELRQ